MFMHISSILRNHHFYAKMHIRGGTLGVRVLPSTNIDWKVRPVPLKADSFVTYDWTIIMQVKLISALEKEFTNDKKELVRGWNLTFLNEQSGETFRHFVNNDNVKGFDPKQIAKISGKNLEISTNAKTYLGKTRVVLDKIVELV